MRQILVLNSARANLLEIQAYTLEMWGGAKVLELQDVIKDTFTFFAFSPFVGRKTSGKNLYVNTLGCLPLVVVYKVSDTHIRIVKVIHMKRNR